MIPDDENGTKLKADMIEFNKAITEITRMAANSENISLLGGVYNTFFNFE